MTGGGIDDCRRLRGRLRLSYAEPVTGYFGGNQTMGSKICCLIFGIHYGRRRLANRAFCLDDFATPRGANAMDRYCRPERASGRTDDDPDRQALPRRS